MTSITLPVIKRSPATAQYHIKNTRPAKFYEPRFRMRPEDRAKTLTAEWFRKTDPLMPAYPYNLDARYPEANEGLYGGMSIQSGNKISKGRNKGKTLRKWYPNIKVERIRSEALDRELTIPIAKRVMRTIEKVGGLDEYLTGTKPARVKELGLLGWKLRWLVVNSPSFKARYAAELLRVGQSGTTTTTTAVAAAVTPTNPLEETFEQAWADPDKREELVQKQRQKWEELQQKDERFKKHVLRNVLADRSVYRVPNLATLSMHDPESIRLRDVDVVEVEGGVSRYKNGANSVQ